MVTDNLARAALLGVATGARSVTPLAALALTGRHTWVKVIAGTAAVGELIADKLPDTPSRVQPVPLGARIVTGALAAGLDARRRGRNVVLPALVGAATAGTASYAGVYWRGFAAQRGFAVPAALLEDAAAVLLAATGSAR